MKRKAENQKLKKKKKDRLKDHQKKRTNRKPVEEDQVVKTEKNCKQDIVKILRKELALA